jgi:hypothetical protein
MSVRLNNPIWDKGKRLNRYAKAIYAVGVEAVKDVEENYRTARRTGVRARVPVVKFSGRGADRKANRTGRYKIVTRSAYGETPARVTGQLQRGTKLKRVSAFAIRIYNDVPHAKHLEPPAKLNRPFLRKPIAANRSKYVEIVRKSLLT